MLAGLGVPIRKRESVSKAKSRGFASEMLPGMFCQQEVVKEESRMRECRPVRSGTGGEFLAHGDCPGDEDTDADDTC